MMRMLQRLISTITLFCLCLGCKVDEDCDITNSVCSKSKCVCSKGYVINSDMTQCLLVSDGYGASCQDSVQCSAVLLSGGQCINQTCHCADSYHYLKGRCWKTSGLGESCTKNENCYVNYDFESSICSNRKCVCSQGYYQREYSSCRRKVSNAGEACLISLDCVYEDSKCLKNRTCGYANETDESYSEELPTSFPIHFTSNKQLGGKCNSNADCGGIKYSNCSPDKQCTCIPGYYQVNNSLCFPEIGSYCSSDSECIGDYMMCRDDKNWCTCRDGYVSTLDNTKCTKMSRDIGWSCLSDRWCSTFGPGGLCIDKKCHCSNSTHYLPQQYYCWITKKVGESCLSDEDCGSNQGSETCSNGVCACKQGFHSATNKTVCRPDGNKIGDFCQENIDCKLKNSMCNVTGEMCVCEPGYMLEDNQCVPGVGGKCDGKDNKCHAESSTCNGTICVCDDQHVSSHDYSQCLIKATYLYEPCTESQQCTQLLGVGAICNSNCTCMEGYHVVNSYCYVNIQLYKTCSKSPECQEESEYTECRNGICQCMYDHPPDAFNRTCTGGGNRQGVISGLLLVFSIVLSMSTLAT